MSFSKMISFCILLFPFFLLSCRDTFKYSIEKEKKVLVDDNKCQVSSFYPVIHLKNNTANIIRLNQNLEMINEMERFAENCSRFFPQDIMNKKKEIIGDYDVLFKTDTLLNIEFFVQSQYLKKTEYRNVFVNLAKCELMDPNRAIPNIDRSKLYPYVKRFSDSTGIIINLKAYEKNSNYSIMFGRTQKDLVLYLGEEGEFEGYYKIIIPLSEVVE